MLLARRILHTRLRAVTTASVRRSSNFVVDEFFDETLPVETRKAKLAAQWALREKQVDVMKSEAALNKIELEMNTIKLQRAQLALLLMTHLHNLPGPGSKDYSDRKRETPENLKRDLQSLLDEASADPRFQEVLEKECAERNIPVEEAKRSLSVMGRTLSPEVFVDEGRLKLRVRPQGYTPEEVMVIMVALRFLKTNGYIDNPIEELDEFGNEYFDETVPVEVRKANLRAELALRERDMAAKWMEDVRAKNEAERAKHKAELELKETQIKLQDIELKYLHVTNKLSLMRLADHGDREKETPEPPTRDFQSLIDEASSDPRFHEIMEQQCVKRNIPVEDMKRSLATLDRDLSFPGVHRSLPPGRPRSLSPRAIPRYEAGDKMQVRQGGLLTRQQAGPLVTVLIYMKTSGYISNPIEELDEWGNVVESW
ncbi:hypothetical protein HDU96_002947 [Phlyctochytrium bullatum]|nr:hypothetical protein HDU96_002947 [Phlyctochytrium bullatum]